MIHVILELYCHWESPERSKCIEVPRHCKYGLCNMGYHCIFNNCKYVDFAEAPYEIAYAGDKGEVNLRDENSWIGFGGDMEPDYLNGEEREQCRKLWEEICKRKIEEAYEEYMQKTGFEKFSIED